MKMLNLAVILIFILISHSKASEIEIIKPLGYAKDTIQETSREAIVLAKADSLNKKLALPYEKYECPPYIIFRASFGDMPHVWYYGLYSCHQSGQIEHRFSYALYNEEEKSIYIPNGDLKAFNSVFHSALHDNFKPIFILNLLSIYVNVAVPWECNLIYGFENDMINLYSSMDKDNLSWITLEQIKWLKELYPLLNVPVKISHIEDKYTFEFNSFNRGERVNQVRHWIFDVYPDSISLVSNTIIKNNIDLTPKQDSLWHEMGFDKKCPR